MFGTFGSFLDVQASFCEAGSQKQAKREGFAVKQAQSYGRHWTLKICIACQAQYKKTFPADMLGGEDEDFLRGVAFWSIRSAGSSR
jgi:hypothetical protein